MIILPDTDFLIYGSCDSLLKLRFPEELAIIVSLLTDNVLAYEIGSKSRLHKKFKYGQYVIIDNCVWYWLPYF